MIKPSAVSLTQVNSEACACAAGSGYQFRTGLGSIPRWLLDAIAFSGCIPRGGRKIHTGLLAANPSKEYTVILLASDNRENIAKGIERNISIQLTNSLFRAKGQPMQILSS